MPLDHYGVLVGTLHDHFRDPEDEQGRWYHVNLEAGAPLGRYRCAIDVDSKKSDIGVQWKVLTVPASAIPVASGLDPGYHELERSESAGAVDLIRHTAFGCGTDWTPGSNLDAAEALESTLTVGARMLIFGEPFETGLGMHNVHQNQGDPKGSQWWDENGIWQDGATLTERPDGDYQAFVSKFTSQASETDDDGHPL